MKTIGKQSCQEQAGLVPSADEVRLLHMRCWYARERLGCQKGTLVGMNRRNLLKKSWKHLRPSNWAYSSLVFFQVGSSPTLRSLEILMNYPYCWAMHFPQRAVPVVLMHLLHVHPHRGVFCPLSAASLANKLSICKKKKSANLTHFLKALFKLGT